MEEKSVVEIVRMKLDDNLLVPPLFVAPVWVVGANHYRGNAFLIDRGRGIFATAAHVLEEAKKGYAYVSSFASGPWAGGALSVEVREEWINWGADVALFKLCDPEYCALLPEVAAMEEKETVIGLRAEIFGFIAEGADSKKLRLMPHYVMGLVAEKDAEWSLDYKDRRRRRLLACKRFFGFGTPRDKMLWFYRKFLLIDRISEPDISEHSLTGLSGSPLMAANKVLGVFVGSNRVCLWVSPISGVKELLKRV